jgi:hypothetical protein
MHRIARAALVAALLIPAAAIAFDRGQWGHDGATSAWFRSLRNGNGTPCCDYADGTRIEDPDWRELENGAYEVFAAGRWVTISPDRVVDPDGRRVGYAILWWPDGWPEPSCFLPGARG